MNNVQSIWSFVWIKEIPMIELSSVRGWDAWSISKKNWCTKDSHLFWDERRKFNDVVRLGLVFEVFGNSILPDSFCEFSSFLSWFDSWFELNSFAIKLLEDGGTLGTFVWALVLVVGWRSKRSYMSRWDCMMTLVLVVLVRIPFLRGESGDIFGWTESKYSLSSSIFLNSLCLSLKTLPWVRFGRPSPSGPWPKARFRSEVNGELVLMLPERRGRWIALENEDSLVLDPSFLCSECNMFFDILFTFVSSSLHLSTNFSISRLIVGNSIPSSSPSLFRNFPI